MGQRRENESMVAKHVLRYNRKKIGKKKKNSNDKTTIRRSLRTTATTHISAPLFYLRCYLIKKYCDVHEKFDFLENARFSTLEHLFKTFWNNLAEFTSTWAWNLRKVHSRIRFFSVATAIATAVYSKNMTKNTDYCKHILTILCNKAVKRCTTRLV